MTIDDMNPNHYKYAIVKLTQLIHPTFSGNCSLELNLFDEKIAKEISQRLVIYQNMHGDDDDEDQDEGNRDPVIS